MEEINIIKNGEHLGTIIFNNDGTCETNGFVGEYDFSNVRKMLIHLSGFDIHFEDLCF
jgi:hypothetical protein